MASKFTAARASAFQRAMREGISRDGHHLYPAFPYTAFTQSSDDDLQARLYPPPRPRSSTRLEPDYAALHQELKRPGVTLQLLWEEYAQANALAYKYTSFCIKYREFAKAQAQRVYLEEYRRSKLAMLMQEAERIAREEFGAKRMAVIAGVGVREYYRKLGYQLTETYMVKELADQAHQHALEQGQQAAALAPEPAAGAE